MKLTERVPEKGQAACFWRQGWLDAVLRGGLRRNVPGVSLIDIGQLRVFSGGLLDLRGQFAHLCPVLFVRRSDVKRQ